jgi:hypothetical protein
MPDGSDSPPLGGPPCAAAKTDAITKDPANVATATRLHMHRSPFRTRWSSRQRVAPPHTFRQRRRCTTRVDITLRRPSGPRAATWRGLWVHQANREKYSVEAMCRILEVAPSGYYDWLKPPLSHRAQEDARLLRLIRASFVASHGIYGPPRVFLDLREAGETCSKHRVARLMRQASGSSPSPSRTRPGSRTSPTSARGRGGSTWPSSWICSRA